MITLKLGSKGELVELLQSFLGIKVSGFFDPVTQKKVIEWQTNNGLKGDGIVGPKTWGSMGIATTDNSETIRDRSGELIINEKFLPIGEYFSGPTKKEWIFLHHTAGWENPYNVIKSWGNDSRGSIATEFVIGGQSIINNENRFDGEIVQAFPKGGYGWHLGTGNNLMHRSSVGIEVCNFGQLSKGGYFKTADGKRTWIPLKSGSFYTYVGREVHEEQIVEINSPFRSFKHWHKYSESQLKSLRELILYIGNRDSIDVRRGLPELIKKNGESAFDFCDPTFCLKNKGLWNHTNVMKGKFDMFPQSELIDLLLSL